MGEERGCRRLDPRSEGGAKHGIAAPRGLSLAPARGGRFGRLFPTLPAGDPGDCAIDELVKHLAAAPASTENSKIVAGYTYLGQFVDHDITFDPTSKIDRDNDPHALVNFRTPRLDLDSMYGSGPADQPFLYDWGCDAHPGVRLRIGHNPPDGCSARIDLPRNDEGRATIGDARNDENLIVSQLHLLFMHFHNKVVERTHAAKPELMNNELFDEACRIVRWHYQWIVTHDYLDRVVGNTMAKCVRPRLITTASGAITHVTQRRIYHWRREPFIPVEFSAAAFRFGHSMVRDAYLVQGHDIPILPAEGCEHEPHLGGFRRLPDTLEIDWRHFFADNGIGSKLIDHKLAKPLFSLPPDHVALASLNLHRGRALGLPCGSDVALAMGQQVLTRQELLPKNLWPTHDCTVERDAVLRTPPLWFYILREASLKPTSLEPQRPNGTFLGKVGGRIVAEVIFGLLEGDPQSYLRQRPAWTPTDEIATLGFEAAPNADKSHVRGISTMADLVEFAAPPRHD